MPTPPAFIFTVSLLLLGGGACAPRETGGARWAAPEPVAEEAPSALPSAPRELPAVPGVEDPARLQGDVLVDGSSTVFPITEAVALELRRVAPGVRVRLGVSGTGGGFAKFCRGQTDVSDASRPIKREEWEHCRAAGVDFVELPVAFDGISVVTHPQNTWATCLRTAELAAIWRPEAEGRIERWNDVRSEWPERPLHLYAPGRDSGTFDYFTSAVVGREGSSRSDFTGSEDDYLLAQDVAVDPDGLGFFGYAYYHEYRDRLGLVAVDDGAGCVAPSVETIAEGLYQPLSRPIFIYLRASSLERSEVLAFARFYLARAPRLVSEVGYVPLPARAYELAARRLERRVTGSVFSGGSQVGVSMERILELEGAGRGG